MEILTSRLKLRHWTEADLPQLLALNSEPEVYNWLGGRILAERSSAALRLIQERAASNAWGVLYVESLDGEFLGMAGLQPLREGLTITSGIEAIWRFRRITWGKGYACESMSAILKTFDESGIKEEIFALIAAPNVRSRNTAERIGFKYDRKLDFQHPDLEEGNPLRPHKVFRWRHF